MLVCVLILLMPTDCDVNQKWADKGTFNTEWTLWYGKRGPCLFRMFYPSQISTFSSTLLVIDKPWTMVGYISNHGERSTECFFGLSWYWHIGLLFGSFVLKACLFLVEILILFQVSLHCFLILVVVRHLKETFEINFDEKFILSNNNEKNNKRKRNKT